MTDTQEKTILVNTWFSLVTVLALSFTLHSQWIVPILYSLAYHFIWEVTIMPFLKLYHSFLDTCLHTCENVVSDTMLKLNKMGTRAFSTCRKEHGRKLIIWPNPFREKDSPWKPLLISILFLERNLWSGLAIT